MAFRFFGKSLPLLVIAVCALAARRAIAANDIPVSTDLNGINQTIGTLTASIAGGQESATFQLGTNYIGLMNDASGNQFRFYQVITSIPDATLAQAGFQWNAPSFDMTAATPLVDPPNGGWRYQAFVTMADGTTTISAGDDSSPFYEADDTGPNNPAFGQQYFQVHNAGNGTVSTSDTPTVASTMFQTFIVYENDALRSQKQIDILAGYTWSTDASSSLSYGMPVEIGPEGIAQAQLALGGDGFSNWSANYGYAMVGVPEPASAALVMTLALPALLQRRARKTIAAKSSTESGRPKG